MNAKAQTGYNAQEAAAYIGLGDDEKARKKFRNAVKRGDIPEAEARIMGVDLWGVRVLDSIFPSNLAAESDDTENPWDKLKNNGQ